MCVWGVEIDSFDKGFRGFQVGLCLVIFRDLVEKILFVVGSNQFVFWYVVLFQI